MAETPPIHSPARTQAQSGSGLDPTQYWCYHCDKRVSVETLPDLPDIVCRDCKNGFVESITAAPAPTHDPALRNQFFQIVSLITQAEREERDDNNRSNGEDEDEIEVVDHRGQGEEDDDEEEEIRFSRRDLASRAVSRLNRIRDWMEILIDIEDRAIGMRLQEPHVGNLGDYVDAAEFEALLQNLAEGDSSGRRGAPPASKRSVEGLETVVILKEENVMGCAICKDVVSVGDVATNLPCGHGYHGGCIVPWLGSRNSCPICRFELPTDDPEYEEERKKRVVMAGVRATPSSSGLGADDAR